MREAFIEKHFSAASVSTIGLVNKILEEYRQHGFRLSLRQLYYQLVARGYIDNSVRSYKNLGNLVSEARQAGEVDWSMIEDRNRETNIPSHWMNPSEIIESAAQSFRIDKWRQQPWHIEVMVEKDALSGVLEPVCRKLDLGITANKGYSSSSTMYEIGKRLQEKHYSSKKNILILYLGDHDPSGIDMTRDVRERLEMYSGLSFRKIEVKRLALNWDQIEKWNPPENPAKESDARYEAYVTKFGESSWELDAIEPTELANIVTTAVKEVRDEKLWKAAVELEASWRTDLFAYSKKFQNSANDEK